ncbi:flavin reductase family protein [Rhizobium tubonense]|uniref:Flavin reductase n=1 Tax=Rhizobium tubonense TaxID=484088 RepID=A0A2W4CTU6_9HYPH|nr:flavin reductase [Rhizobium tubonense]
MKASVQVLETADQASDLVDAASFKASMRHLAGAVSVVTVGVGDDRTGFTATSVSSLSAEVPSVIVSLNRGSSSWPVLQRHGSFCVNVLAHDQQHVAHAFAGYGGRNGVHRYEGAEWSVLETGALALQGALTAVDCELDEVVQMHSHAILIGRVRAVTLRTDVEPLLYWKGAFRVLADSPTVG